MPKYVVEYSMEEFRSVEVEAESAEQAQQMVEDWSAFDEYKNPHADTDHCYGDGDSYKVMHVDRAAPQHDQQELIDIADAILKAVN
jgi:hypothetical protein